MLESLFAEVKAREELLEKSSNRNFAAENDVLWTLLWNSQHELTYSAFLQIFLKLQKVNTLNECIAIAGTIHRLVAFISILHEKKICSLSEEGMLYWSKDVFIIGLSLSIDTAIVARAYIPKKKYGQLISTIESSRIRLELWNDYVGQCNQKVLFLGDDDMTSILFAREKFDIVTVLDIDEELLSYLDNYFTDEIPIGCNQYVTTLYDVRKPLPVLHRAQYDSVFLDPIDDHPWLMLWLTRAISALKIEVGTRIFLSVSRIRLGLRYFDILKFLLERGFVIEHIVHNANRYPLKEVGDAFYSSMNQELQKIGLNNQSLKDLCIYTDLIVFLKINQKTCSVTPIPELEIRRGV